MMREVGIIFVDQPLQIRLRRRLQIFPRNRGYDAASLESFDNVRSSTKGESHGRESRVGGESGGDSSVTGDVEVTEIPNLRVEVGDGQRFVFVLALIGFLKPIFPVEGCEM